MGGCYILVELHHEGSAIKGETLSNFLILLTKFCEQSLQRDAWVSYLNPNESRNTGVEVEIMQSTTRKTLITEAPVDN